MLEKSDIPYIDAYFEKNVVVNMMIHTCIDIQMCVSSIIVLRFIKEDTP